MFIYTIIIVCPHKCPRARISDERLFEELNWRPEFSFCHPGEASRPPGEHLIESVVYSITSVIWPGEFDAQLSTGCWVDVRSRSWVFSAVAHHGLI